MLCCTGNDGGVLKVSIKHHTLQTFHYNTVRLLVTCNCYLKCAFLHDLTLKKIIVLCYMTKRLTESYYFVFISVYFCMEGLIYGKVSIYF